MTNINMASQVNGCSVKLVSWNVKSLNHPVKRKKVFAHLKDLKTILHSFRKRIYAFLTIAGLEISGWVRLFIPTLNLRLEVWR